MTGNKNNKKARNTAIAMINTNTDAGSPAIVSPDSVELDDI